MIRNLSSTLKVYRNVSKISPSIVSIEANILKTNRPFSSFTPILFNIETPTITTAPSKVKLKRETYLFISQ
jgi:hypothetical protein